MTTTKSNNVTSEDLLNKLGQTYTEIQTALDLAKDALLKSERKHQVISNSKQALLELKHEFGEVDQLKMDRIIPQFIWEPKSGIFVSEEDAKKDLIPLLEITEHLMSVAGGQTPQKDVFITEDAPYEGRKILRSIFNQAKSRLLIVDAYLRPEILEVLQLNLEDVGSLELNFLTQKNNNRFFTTFSSDLSKLAKQYPGHNILMKYYDNLPSHDRYIIIDDVIIYHFGYSLAELGNRASSINKIEGNALNSAKQHIPSLWNNGQL